MSKSSTIKLWTEQDDLKMLFICMWGWEACEYTKDSLANVLERSEDAISMRVGFFSGFYGVGGNNPETEQMWNCWEKYKYTPMKKLRHIAFRDLA